MFTTSKDILASKRRTTLWQLFNPASTEMAQTMMVGDLVQKRWGCIDPHEQGTVGVYIGKFVHPHTNPAFDGYFIKVFYPGQPIRRYRKNEFIVIQGDKNG